ncbi:D123-domain-containing protein [Infundibulicybe gibba]|nr:D123-domain-containing protein [Infundibulicybe gibba]
MPLFPDQTTSYVLSFQFSSWFPRFASLSLKSTIVRPLTQEFCDYLNSDGVFVPEGSENLPTESAPSDEGEDSDNDTQNHFAFPELDQKIRDCIKEYGAVFPKLNFSSPKDASWILPQSSPLKCTEPSEVYILLKSSDFIAHDLSRELVFDGCGVGDYAPYELELVLRKWYPIDRSRELRCFVRQNKLLGVASCISQRDPNYYEFLNDSLTQAQITSAVEQYWKEKIKPKWELNDYIFDILLTRDLMRAHILDFNPYSPRTDPLLFTYEELDILLGANRGPGSVFKVIDSRTHPAAISNSPVNQHNMVPFEALSLSSGKDIEEFAEAWKEEIKQSMSR